METIFLLHVKSQSPELTARHRVAITGIGIVSPLGSTREETWRQLLEGRSGAAPITTFDASTWPVKFACEVKDWQPELDWILPQYREFLNRSSQFGVFAAREAIEDANLVEADFAKSSLFVGTNIGSIPPQHLYELYNFGPSPVEESCETSLHQVLRNHPTALASVIAGQWKFKGRVSTIQTACASSAQAIGAAYNDITLNNSRRALVGGSDSLSAELMLSGFALIGTLSKRNSDPQKASRPFDKERDGFVAGEGAAFLVLENMQDAIDRGAKIYAEICGYGETLSAYRITDLPPDGRGIVEAMQLAIHQGDISADKISYINAHGTSTELNDRIEALAIERVCSKQNSAPTRVTSTKSQTGHLISAAGAIELCFSVLSIRDGIIPMTINYISSDFTHDVEVVNQKQPMPQNGYVLSNSIGFGGSNASVLVRGLAVG